MNVGTLYLVATPIGNLGDMSPRAVEMLKNANIVAAEDTRRTLQLLNHFGIQNRLVRYDEHSKERQGPVLLAALQAGEDVALVSDAGFPGISDPGEAMTQLAIANGIPVVPVPGANAALSALVASGLPSTPFFFGGFLPKSKKNRMEQLAAWRFIPATIVLYEAPHRLREVLQSILDAWGDRPLTLARELTKLHEEFWRGTVSGAIARFRDEAPRGEFVLVLGAASAEELEEASPQGGETEPADPLEAVKQLLAQGADKKQALQQIAKRYKIPKRELYNALLHDAAENATGRATETFETSAKAETKQR